MNNPGYDNAPFRNLNPFQ